MQHVRKLWFVLVILLLPPTLCSPLYAQSATSQVTGVVTDPTGAAVPGANVQIKNTSTNAIRTTTSNEKGEYSFPSLDIGSYRLQVKKEGFTTYIQNGIVLEINTNPAIMVSMKVGAVTEEIEITANTAMVETQNPSVSQVINPQQVVDLPLNGRQATDLIALSGAAVSTTNTSAGTSTINTLDYPSAVSYSVAGSQANATNYYLDGAQHLDYRTNVGLPMPFPDALAEFNLGISAMPANLGIHPGGTVNGVTRSGGNVFHGNVFDFVRNGAMDADIRTFATRAGKVSPGARDTLTRNQFGGTIGGPIRKDKLFFFAGYQGTNQSSTTASTTTTIPTYAMLGGDLSALLPSAPGATTSAAGCAVQTVNSAFTTAPGNNMIQSQYVSTPSAVVMQNLYKYIPASGFYDVCGDYAYRAAPAFVSESQIVGRVDWQRTRNERIFGRYFISKYSEPSYYTAGNIYSSNGVGLADQVQTLALGDTLLLGAHAINDLRVSFDRTATQRTSNTGIPTACQLGMNATCPVANNEDILTGVKPGFEGYDYENSYGFSEGWAWTNGVHQFNAGFTFLHVQMNGDGTFQMDPETTFNSATTGATYGDEVTGNVDSITQGNGQLSRDGQNQPAAYVQDAWKVLPRLQLTGGVRWDPFISQHNKYGMASDFSLTNYTLGVVSQKYVNAPPGISFPGDPGFRGTSDTVNTWTSFAPRVGFVWDITGQGKMTLRGGYGYFYDTSVLWNTMHVVLNPPWGETLTFTPLSVAAGGGLANPYAGSNGPNPFPTGTNPPSTFAFPNNGTFIFENQSNKPEYVQQWNLAFQKQVTNNLLLSATYIGNKTTHLWLGISQNYANYLPAYGTTGSCTLPYGTSTYTFTICNQASGKSEYDTTHTVLDVNARRALTMIHPQYGAQLAGGLTSSFSWGDGAYNGLLLSAQQRMAHGFQVLGNFTWSHCMDDGEIGQDIGNIPMDPTHPKASSWGNCSYNKKEIGNISIVAQTPHYGNRLINALASGWNGSGIFTASTGNFYSMSDNYDNSFNGVGSDRPNIVGNPNVGGTVSANPTCVAPAQVHTLAYWYNPCAFAFSAPGTFGGEVRNDQVGPPDWNLNLALWRSFPLPEKIKLDFRVEAFNALNHAQYGNPTATLATSSSNTALNGNAGLITVNAPGYQPRIFQLAVKASF